MSSIQWTVFRGRYSPRVLCMMEGEGDLGFGYTAVKNGTVLIRHHSKLATTLRGAKAGAFMKKMDLLDFNRQQQWMARVTGNYKRGNERLSRNHFKNMS